MKVDQPLKNQKLSKDAEITLQDIQGRIAELNSIEKHLSRIVSGKEKEIFRKTKHIEYLNETELNLSSRVSILKSEEEEILERVKNANIEFNTIINDSKEKETEINKKKSEIDLRLKEITLQEEDVSKRSSEISKERTTIEEERKQISETKAKLREIVCM